MMRLPNLTLNLLTPALLLAAACSGDDSADTSATDPSTSTSTSTTSDPSTSASSESDSTSSSTSTSTSTTGDPTTSTTEPETTSTTSDPTGDPDVDAFRFNKIFVRDPHFWITPLFGCEDITDKSLPLVDSVNKQFNDAIQNDKAEPKDGMLDMNFMLLFMPLDQASGGEVAFATGDCTAPIQATSCAVKAGTDPSPTTYKNEAEGMTCFEPVPGELSPANYNPKPGVTTGPCFNAGPLSFTLDLGNFQLPFADATIAAQYVGDPADEIIQGSIRGFISEEVADMTKLPMDIPLLGGKGIGELLAGHAKNCQKGHDDRDLNGNTSGWWFYIEFEATRVPFTGG